MKHFVSNAYMYFLSGVSMDRTFHTVRPRTLDPVYIVSYYIKHGSIALMDMQYGIVLYFQLPDLITERSIYYRKYII